MRRRPRGGLAKRYPAAGTVPEERAGRAWDVRVYGVSAQGGQLSKKGEAPGPDRDRLLALDHPSERIKIVGPDVRETRSDVPIVMAERTGH